VGYNLGFTAAPVLADMSAGAGTIGLPQLTAGLKNAAATLLTLYGISQLADKSKNGSVQEARSNSGNSGSRTRKPKSQPAAASQPTASTPPEGPKEPKWW
jgi:hypothetical protein